MLTAKQKLVMSLRHREGMNQAAIAKLLRISQSAVSRHLQRAEANADRLRATRSPD
jgi:RNA polymerase sigma factor (sigma-70 family)